MKMKPPRPPLHFWRGIFSPKVSSLRSQTPLRPHFAPTSLKLRGATWGFAGSSSPFNPTASGGVFWQRGTKVLPVFLVLSFVLLASPALAVGKPDTLSGRPSGLPTRVQNRLTEVKLKACQARENAINTRFERLNQLVTTMEGKFDAIAARVEEYYTTKVVPSGKTVANYDSLVADIAANKAAVQTGLAKAQNDISVFSCDGSDPKGQMMTYRLDMQGVVQGLKDYRTSIKDLIVSVRSVTRTTERANPSVSPEPTE